METLYNHEKTAEIKKMIHSERQSKTILPDGKSVFRAFKLTPYEKLKVVIIGQDPYPSEKHADGMAFSSKSEITPGSLKNIFEEIKRSFFPSKNIVDLFGSNDLTGWAKQGILLYNKSLTVEEGVPGSHTKIWSWFSEQFMEVLNNHPNKLVFILMGADPKKLLGSINENRHTVLFAPHPSPMVKKEIFVGSGIFDTLAAHLKYLYFEKVFESLRYWFRKDENNKHRNMYYDQLAELRRLKIDFDMENYDKLIDVHIDLFVDSIAFISPDVQKLYLPNFKTER